MAYNKAKEEYRWNQWKAEEEKILREQGVDEETIQKLREYDWNDFNAERRFREHQTSLLDCMEPVSYTHLVSPGTITRQSLSRQSL